MDPITITPERLTHMLHVARTCYQLSHDHFGWDEDKCRQMFVLGLVHDIGYEFVSDQLDHAAVGGEILRSLGFRYHDEVSTHGFLPKEGATPSLESVCLNLADLGYPGSVSERLQGIADRYGEDSFQFREAVKLARYFEHEA